MVHKCLNCKCRLRVATTDNSGRVVACAACGMGGPEDTYATGNRGAWRLYHKMIKRIREAPDEE